MSGHSKWSTIKRQKGAADAKRGALFTKLGRMITVAAREKGGNPDTNFSLRMAIDKAKAANMPKENIEKAIKRGTGESEEKAIQELLYEGFGPAKSQFIIKCLTDNKNRSASNIRHLFAKHGGSLGSVAWNFEQKGVIRVADSRLPIDDLELELIDAGTQDIVKEEEGTVLFAKPEDLRKVKRFLDSENIGVESADIEYVAKEKLKVGAEDKEKIEKFIEALEDNEDIADYYTNVEL